MKNFIGKRMVHMILTMFVASIVIFTMVKCMPSDPVQSYLGLSSKATSEQREQLREELGLNDTLPVQYIKWIERNIQGDLGVSLYAKRPVKDMIVEATSHSFILYLFVFVASIVLSILLSLLLVVRQSKRLTSIFHTLSLLVLSIPSYFLALLLLFLFYQTTHILPLGMQNSYYAAIGYSSIFSYLSDLLLHAFLPFIVLTLITTLSFMRYLYVHLDAEKQEQYVVVANAKGLSKWKIAYRHIFRNVVSSFFIYISGYFPILFSGSLLIESVFQWNGVGHLLLTSIQNGDESLMIAILFISACITIIGNFIFDGLAVFIDPRLLEERRMTFEE